MVLCFFGMQIFDLVLPEMTKDSTKFVLEDMKEKMAASLSAWSMAT